MFVFVCYTIHFFLRNYTINGNLWPVFASNITISKRLLFTCDSDKVVSDTDVVCVKVGKVDAEVDVLSDVDVAPSVVVVKQPRWLKRLDLINNNYSAVPLN